MPKVVTNLFVYPHSYANFSLAYMYSIIYLNYYKQKQTHIGPFYSIWPLYASMLSLYKCTHKYHLKIKIVKPHIRPTIKLYYY